MELVVADIGGTHARFALATTGADGVIDLGVVTVLKTADHASLQTAWEAFAAIVGRPLPPAAAIAVAGAQHVVAAFAWSAAHPQLLAEEPRVRAAIGVRATRRAGTSAGCWAGAAARVAASLASCARACLASAAAACRRRSSAARRAGFAT